MWRRAARLPFAVAGQLLRWLDYSASADHLLPGNQLRVLVDGEMIFPAMLDAIASAREYIHLEIYIWEPDSVGIRFAEALKERARAGVKVRVIFDGFGSSNLSWDFVHDLRDAKIEALEFRPLIWMARKGQWRALRRRDHRKILVVDGEVSFCGGINLGDDYAPHSQGGRGWRDTHMEIRGPVTQQLDELFRDTWHQHGGRPYPRRPAARTSARPEPTVLAGALSSDEAGQRSTIRRHYLHAIRRAEKQIYIANAYFVPSRAMVKALCAASKRGVEVRLLLPDDRHNDVVPVQLASQHLYSTLLEAGVHIHWWPISHMHAKTAVVDGVWSIVGSYNLDAVSLFYSLEVVVEVIGPSFGEEMQRMFQADFDRSIELDLETWQRRSLFDRAAEPLFYRLRRFL